MKHTRNATNPAVISWFDDFGGPNPYAFLSNFYVGEPLVFGDKTYATGEHLFAALKAGTDEDHEAVRLATGPGAAKGVGRAIDLRPGWNEIKYDAMAVVLALKFTLDRYEGQALLTTGNALLVEGTHWGDSVWGVVLGPRGLPWEQYGRNWLGRLLMARRAELFAEQEFGVATKPQALEDFIRPPLPIDEAEWDFAWDVDEVTTGADGQLALDEDLLPWKAPAPFRVARRTPFCIDANGGCVNPNHLHADPINATYGDDDNLTEYLAQPVKLTSGRFDHSDCGHAATKNARARCRRRLKGSK